MLKKTILKANHQKEAAYKQLFSHALPLNSCGHRRIEKLYK